MSAKKDGFRCCVTNIVPIALSRLQRGALKLEGPLPGSRFARVVGEGQLPMIAVPRTEQVNSLAIGGSAQGKAELERRHDCVERSVTLGLIRRGEWVWELDFEQEE